MITYKHTKDLEAYLTKQKVLINSVGFVPTMGALHAGHLSLIQRCKAHCDLTVCSIFVNPTQFNNSVDFEKYPKTIDNDVLLLEENGCDILFLPDEQEMYPNSISMEKHYDLGYLETILEGKFRPGHFQGVCMIVEKLLNIVNPDYLFMGQKDYQQCMVVKRLIQLMHKKIEIIICPILREESGLAMSSRNVRLSTSERKLASELQRQLMQISEQLDKHNFSELKDHAITKLEKSGFKIEYLELARSNDLTLISQFENKSELIILIAVFLGPVRLIDNLLINQ